LKDVADGKLTLVTFTANFEMLLNRVKPISKPSELHLIKTFVEGIGSDVAARALQAMKSMDEASLAVPGHARLLDTDGNPTSWLLYRRAIYHESLHKKG
jgi:hypothetical protein